MRKMFTLLTAALLVIGVAGFASADCVNCAGDAGNIARGCEGFQQSCEPWDFETPQDYCDYYYKAPNPNRAIFKICDCIPGEFSSLVEGDTLDISMEILVDKGNGDAVGGDNGVYWAENVNYGSGIPMATYSDQVDAWDDIDGDDDYFKGYFTYLLGDGKTEGDPNTSKSDCSLSDLERVTMIVLDREMNLNEQVDHGYTIKATDEIESNFTWWIDIPMLRADPDMVEAGWKVYVKICLAFDDCGICAEDDMCCCEILIGELCCESDPISSELVFPYYPPTGKYWDLMGMAVTNTSAFEGTFTVTWYESDGDVATYTDTIGANAIFLTTIMNLAANATITDSTGGGTLGDSMAYAVVSANFNAYGFAMIATSKTGESIGYLAED